MDIYFYFEAWAQIITIKFWCLPLQLQTNNNDESYIQTACGAYASIFQAIKQYGYGNDKID